MNRDKSKYELYNANSSFKTSNNIFLLNSAFRTSRYSSTTKGMIDMNNVYFIGRQKSIEMLTVHSNLATIYSCQTQYSKLEIKGDNRYESMEINNNTLTC